MESPYPLYTRGRNPPMNFLSELPFGCYGLEKKLELVVAFGGVNGEIVESRKEGDGWVLFISC